MISTAHYNSLAGLTPLVGEFFAMHITWRDGTRATSWAGPTHDEALEVVRHCRTHIAQLAQITIMRVRTRKRTDDDT